MKNNTEIQEKISRVAIDAANMYILPQNSYENRGIE